MCCGICSLEHEEEVDGGGFENVNTNMRDVEIECGEDIHGEKDVEGNKETVRIGANLGKGARADNQERGDCKEAEDDIAVLNSFGKKRHLDEKIQIHCCVNEDESDDDAAK